MRQPPWVLHGGWGTWRRQQPWLQYCPRCLQEDADPYFRRRWRLAFVTICPAHRQQLLDRCAVCSAVVNFHASPPMRWLSRSAITVRVICAWPTRPRWHRVLPRRLLWFQTSLLVAMQRGWCYLTGDRPVRATYLQALHRLQSVLAHSATHPPVQTGVAPEHNTCFSPGFSCASRQAIEGLSVVDRLRLMLLVASWVTQWPTQVIAAGLSPPWLRP